VYIDHYAVLGNPIGHSQSPFIHQQFAQATQQAMEYVPILVPPGDFTSTVQTFFAGGGKGCNITLPFKEEAYRVCAYHTERALAAKAVNTIKQTPAGLLGDNTDGAGLLADLSQYIALADTHILILGAGGAARGVLLPLLKAKPASLTIANRTIAKAALLCQEFMTEALTLQPIALSELPSHPVDIIINATSVSLQQNTLALPNDLFSSTTLAYDMGYGMIPSPFLQQAARCHVPYTIDGLGMLVYQAAEAFHLWRGVYPETAPVLAALRQHLAQDIAR
jgi:shikimate dehydrogenase